MPVTLPRPRKIDTGVKTISPADRIYSEVQSSADEVSYAKSFIVDNELKGNTAGTILFQQSISARSLAIMQQHATADGADPMLVAYIENYLDYRLAACSVKLDSIVPPLVSGTVAVMFCPESLRVDASNFVRIIESRTAGGKLYPGTYLVPLDKLRRVKNMNLQGFIKGGARPINAPLGSDADKTVVGKLVIGIFSETLTSEVATTPSNSASSSNDQGISNSTLYVGPICKFSMHADVRFIFSAPGQIPPEGAVYSLQQPLQFTAPLVRYDPVGPGDYAANLLIGPTPADLTDLQNSSIPLGPGSPLGQVIVPELLTMVGSSSLDDTTALFTATTAREISETIVTGVAEFFPPGIKQLITWGGRTMLGVIDRIVNSQYGMLAKTTTMQQSNRINNSRDFYDGDEDIAGLTPANSIFQPGQYPFSGIPFGYVPQGVFDMFVNAPAGSVANSIAQCITNCFVRGIYPFFMTANYGNPDATYCVQSIQELFVRNINGTPSLISTYLQPSTTPDDEYAGLPLSIHESIAKIGPWNTSYPTTGPPRQPMLILSGLETASPLQKGQAIWEVPVIDFIDYKAFSQLDGEKLLYTWQSTLTIPQVRQKISDFFGVEPVTSGTDLIFSVKMSYALRLVKINLVDDWSVFQPRSPRSNDNGCVILSFTVPTGILNEIDFYSAIVVKAVETITRSATLDSSGVFPIRPFEWQLDTGYHHVYDVSIQGGPLF